MQTHLLVFIRHSCGTTSESLCSEPWHTGESRCHTKPVPLLSQDSTIQLSGWRILLKSPLQQRACASKGWCHANSLRTIHWTEAVAPNVPHPCHTITIDHALQRSTSPFCIARHSSTFDVTFLQSLVCYI